MCIFTSRTERVIIITKRIGEQYNEPACCLADKSGLALGADKSDPTTKVVVLIISQDRIFRDRVVIVRKTLGHSNFCLILNVSFSVCSTAIQILLSFIIHPAHFYEMTMIDGEK